MCLQSVVVASAVLVSAFHLLQWNVEIVKRWSNEIQEAVQSKTGMVQARNYLCWQCASSIRLYCTTCGSGRLLRLRHRCLSLLSI